MGRIMAFGNLNKSQCTALRRQSSGSGRGSGSGSGRGSSGSRRHCRRRRSRTSRSRCIGSCSRRRRSSSSSSKVVRLRSPFLDRGGKVVCLFAWGRLHHGRPATDPVCAPRVGQINTSNTRQRLKQ